MNTPQNEFIGCSAAIVVESQEQFQKLREFMGIKNLFLTDGTPAAQLNLQITSKRIAFFRNDEMKVAYDHPANIPSYLKIYEFNEVFAEQRTLFGGEETPLIKQPEQDLIQPEPLDDVDPMGEVIDAETKVKQELTLAETLNKLEVGSITPATITGNVLEFKDTVIKAVNKYKGIIVTKDNFKDLTATRADLNSKKSVITESRKNIKKEALKEIDEVYNAMTDIIGAIDGVVKPLDADIKKFEQEEKNALKNKLINTVINPMLDMLISKEMIDQPTKEQFTFNDKWLNKSAFTTKGELTKKTKEELNAELSRLTALYQNKKQDIETIKSTVNTLQQAHNLTAELQADTYIALYNNGVTIPQIQERINQDIANLKKAVDNAVQKEVQKAQTEPQTQQQVQDIQKDENIENTQEIKNLADEKTGEVLAHGNYNRITASVQRTPEKFEGREFEYTYKFKGSFGVIKTFSNILKLLSILFEDFKYERVGK